MKSKDRIKIAIAFMILIGTLTFLFLIPLVKADLGSFKQNSCVSIRVLANCSTINLTEVSNNNFTYVINSQMTYLGGQTFNYTFCNTSLIDTYTYSWNNKCVDCSENDCGNSFTITSTGEKVSLSNIILVIVFLFVTGLFFILGFTFSNDKWIIKSFFYLCSLLMALISINTARIIATESLNLGRMADLSFIFLIPVISFFFLYVFINWSIETFKHLKNKKDIRWNY